MEAQAVSTALPFPRLAYSLAESEALSGLSRSSLYRLIAAGKLKTVLHGRRRLVPVQELNRLLGQESMTRMSTDPVPPVGEPMSQLQTALIRLLVEHPQCATVVEETPEPYRDDRGPRAAHLWVLCMRGAQSRANVSCCHVCGLKSRTRPAQPCGASFRRSAMHTAP